jgi:hypothetical protein
MRLEESSCLILELLWARHPQNEAYNPNSSDLTEFRNIYKNLAEDQLHKDQMDFA